MTSLHLRRYRPSDLDAVYEIACRTGAAGEDASEQLDDRRLIGEIWAAPYVTFEPEHAYVVADESGRAVGYVIATVDAVAFAARCAADWWPALRRRHPLVAGIDEQRRAERLDDRLIARIHNPPAPLAALAAEYPSELHIDLLPIAQGGGWGRRMIDRVLASLRAAGSVGVHLGTSDANPRAVAFYRHLGFEELFPAGPDAPTRWFGRRL